MMKQHLLFRLCSLELTYKDVERYRENEALRVTGAYRQATWRDNGRNSTNSMEVGRIERSWRRPASDCLFVNEK